MSDLFDLSNFDKYKEDNCREVKKAEGGLPIALWESYSSFANSNGGVIILGVGEPVVVSQIFIRFGRMKAGQCLL